MRDALSRFTKEAKMILSLSYQNICRRFASTSAFYRIGAYTVKSTLAAVLVGLTLSFSALAHIDPGLWKGVAAGGKECVLEVFEQTFEGGQPHPLNERIRVRLYGEEFQIFHPRAADLKKGTVAFNHDRFESYLATPVGASGIVITMVHSEKFEGPTEYRLIRDNWKTKTSTMLFCKGLKHVAIFR